jgi:hypothetical protein
MDSIIILHICLKPLLRGPPGWHEQRWFFARISNVACYHQIPPRKDLYAWTLIGALHTLFTTPIHCQQYAHRWMFDCCRIPGPHGLDWSISYTKEGDLGDSGHIIVFRKNRVWKVETAKGGRLLSTHEIEKYITPPILVN